MDSPVTGKRASSSRPPLGTCFARTRHKNRDIMRLVAVTFLLSFGLGWSFQVCTRYAAHVCAVYDTR